MRIDSSKQRLLYFLPVHVQAWVIDRTFILDDLLTVVELTDRVVLARCKDLESYSVAVLVLVVLFLRVPKLPNCDSACKFYVVDLNFLDWHVLWATDLDPRQHPNLDSEVTIWGDEASIVFEPWDRTDNLLTFKHIVFRQHSWEEIDHNDAFTILASKKVTKLGELHFFTRFYRQIQVLLHSFGENIVAAGKCMERSDEIVSSRMKG